MRQIYFQQTPHTMRVINIPQSPVNEGMSGTGQTIINRFFGATPDQPIRIPLELPEISLSQDTMEGFGEMVIKGTLIVGAAIVVSKIIEGQFKR